MKVRFFRERLFFKVKYFPREQQLFLTRSALNSDTNNRRHFDETQANFNSETIEFLFKHRLANQNIYLSIYPSPFVLYRDQPHARLLPTQENTEKRQTEIHASRGIRTHDSSISAHEDSSYL
jgi:hypothetical protein